MIPYLRRFFASPVARVMAGGVMISFSAVFARLTTVEPDVAAFYRTFVGGLFLVGLSLYRKESLRLPRRVLPWAVGAGVSLVLDLVFWHRSISVVGPGLATILINFQVFVLAVAGWICFSEQVPKRLLVAVPMALTGLWLIVGVDVAGLPPNTVLGILLGLGAAFWLGMYTLTVRIARSIPGSPGSAPSVAVISLTSALLLAGVCLYQGQSLGIPTVRDGLWLFLYGLVSQGIGWLLIAGGLPNVPAFVAGMAILIMPTLSFIWDILLFQRPTGPMGVFGAVLALAAIRLGVSGGKQAPKCESSGCERGGR
jgi:drug/metabolite transporter (DMT)-like permease